jgi:hypothetical protein
MAERSIRKLYMVRTVFVGRLEVKRYGNFGTRHSVFCRVMVIYSPHIAGKISRLCWYMLHNKVRGLSTSVPLCTCVHLSHAAFSPSPQPPQTLLRPDQPPRQHQCGQWYGDNPIHPKHLRYRRRTTVIGLPLQHVHAEERSNEGAWKKYDCEHCDGLHSGTVSARFECYRSGVIGLVLGGYVKKLY